MRRRRTSVLRWGTLVVTLGAACNALVGIDEPVVVQAKGAHCVLNSECANSEHVCLFGTCSPPCEADRDCDAGERCLGTDLGKGCIGEGQGDCSDVDTCPPGTACFDGQCRTDCRANATVCLDDQLCGADGACRGTSEPTTGGTGGTGPTGGQGGTGGAGRGGATGTGGTGQGGEGETGGEPGGGDSGTTGTGGTSKGGGAGQGGSMGGSSAGGMSGTAGAGTAGGGTGGGGAGSGSVGKALGDSCTGGGQCQSTICVQQVCCDGACTGACQSCTRPSNPGTCGTISFTGDTQNCGACGTVCSTNHVSGSNCVASACTGTCQAGFANCNGNLQSDGCEINTTTGDPDRCGGCNTVCSPNHVMNRACSGSLCQGTCQSPWLNCVNGLQADGCETDGGAASNCGACGNVCPYGYCQNQATPTCSFTLRGDNTNGANSENRAAGTLQGMLIQGIPAGTLRALGIRAGAIAGTPHVRLGLYQDSGGAPQSLVAQTGSLTAVANGAVEGLVTPVTITGGDYWLFFVSDTTLRAVTDAASAVSWWTNSPFTYGTLPTTLPPLTGFTLTRAHLYVITTP